MYTFLELLFLQFLFSLTGIAFQSCANLERSSFSVQSRVLSDRLVRDTQQTVSANNCSEDLISPTILGLKCDEELELSLAQIFVKW